jgi:hypothetical protein
VAHGGDGALPGVCHFLSFFLLFFSNAQLLKERHQQDSYEKLLPIFGQLYELSPFHMQQREENFFSNPVKSIN